LGTEPRPLEKDRVSEVRFSWRTLSTSSTGIGSGVGVAVLLGRKIVLKPLPVNVPANSASGPRLGAGELAIFNGVRLDTSPNLKLPGSERAVSSFASLICSPP
jgi:hypothetical protein